MFALHARRVMCRTARTFSHLALISMAVNLDRQLDHRPGSV
jgi:hypothetical protein